MKKNRVVSLDLIRMVAVLLVITQHAWSGLRLDDAEGGLCYVYQELVVMGVPLFFMLSGALLLDREPSSISKFLGRRFKRLLIPYLFWSTSVYIISVVMHKYPDVHTLSDAICFYIPYLLSGRINPSYWYIFVLIGLYLLAPFLQYALSTSHAKRLTFYGLLLWLIWITLRTYYPEFGSMAYYKASAFMYMGFFLCGHYCVNYLKDERTNRRLSVIGFVSGYVVSVYGLIGDFSTPLAHTLAVISLFLLLKSFRLSHRMSSFITSSGRYTYVVYFVHVPLVGMLCMLDMWGWCPLWTRPLVIASVSFFISFLVAYLFDRARFVPNAWVGI